jgi:2-oxo-4-hydroxy-4-carboxy-5-ureidoimidazoline decarboxylase
MMTDDEKAAFVARYADIYEHSPWVAERAARVLDAGADVHTIGRVMADCVDNASAEQQLELMRAHPDLAGKAAIAATLTEASTNEQASAGLDRCTPAEFEKFQALNAAYRRKFGFPFIMAVRGSTRRDILAAFAARLNHAADVEFETALKEIHRIAALRLEALDRNHKQDAGRVL